MLSLSSLSSPQLGAKVPNLVSSPLCVSSAYMVKFSNYNVSNALISAPCVAICLREGTREREGGRGGGKEGRRGEARRGEARFMCNGSPSVHTVTVHPL